MNFHKYHNSFPRIEIRKEFNMYPVSICIENLYS